MPIEEDDRVDLTRMHAWMDATAPRPSRSDVRCLCLRSIMASLNLIDAIYSKDNNPRSLAPSLVPWQRPRTRRQNMRSGFSAFDLTIIRLTAA